MAPSLGRPFLVEVSDDVAELVFLKEVNELKSAHFTIVSDALVLPATTAGELVGTCEEKYES